MSHKQTTSKCILIAMEDKCVQDILDRGQKESVSITVCPNLPERKYP